MGPLGTDPVTLDEADFGKEKNGVQGWRWLLQVAYGERVRRLWIVQEQLLNQDLVMLHGFSLCPWDAVASIPLLFAVQLLPKLYIDHFWQEYLQSSCLQVLRIEVLESDRFINGKSIYWSLTICRMTRYRRVKSKKGEEGI